MACDTYELFSETKKFVIFFPAISYWDTDYTDNNQHVWQQNSEPQWFSNQAPPATRPRKQTTALQQWVHSTQRRSMTASFPNICPTSNSGPSRKSKICSPNNLIRHPTSSKHNCFLYQEPPITAHLETSHSLLSLCQTQSDAGQLPCCNAKSEHTPCLLLFGYSSFLFTTSYIPRPPRELWDLSEEFILAPEEELGKLQIPLFPIKIRKGLDILYLDDWYEFIQTKTRTANKWVKFQSQSFLF